MEPITAVAGGLATSAEGAALTTEAAGLATEAASAAGAAQAAETAGLAAETAATIGESGVATETASNLATQLEQGLQAGQHPDDLLKKVTEAPTEAAETFSSGQKEAQSSGESLKTEDKEPTVAIDEAKSGEEPNINPEISSDDQASIDASVRDNLDKWDDEHPTPNKDTDPEGYNKWCRNRVEAQNKHTVDARVNNELRKWGDLNPEPESKNSKDFDEWVKARTEKEKELRNQFKTDKETQSEAVTGQENDQAEKEDKKEMSDVEIAAKIKRLKELYGFRADLIQAIAILKDKPTKTDEDKLRMADYKVRKDISEVEIKIIEQELAMEITKTSLAKKIAIVALLATVATVALASAGQSRNKS